VIHSDKQERGKQFNASNGLQIASTFLIAPMIIQFVFLNMAMLDLLYRSLYGCVTTSTAK
jgi:hypothetical protein